MIKKFSVLVSVFALLLCFGTFAFGQETTGDIEITVKDPNGAVVPNVSITIVSAEGSSTAGFKKTVMTDDQGFVRIIKVPPGLYTITAAATGGFAERIIQAVPVSLGKVTPVMVDFGVANVTDTVTVNSTDVNPIDTSSTKIETTISAQTAELLPKGTNFASILKISPATRPEPRSGQFQIDGASGSENTFIIDGQEVTNVRTGVLNSNSNLPFQVIQEVQIKSSGFEAEYGGATGGVVNVVTKGGSNQWRGEFGLGLRLSGIEPIGRPTLRLRTNPSPRSAEYFPAKSDNYNEYNPSLNLSGPILKDRVWFFASYTPQIFTQKRNIEYFDTNNRTLRTFPTQTYKYKSVDDYTFLRLDAQPFSRLRLTGTYLYNPIAETGAIPTWTTGLFRTPPPLNPCRAPICQPGNPSLNGAAYLNQTGGRQNSQSVTAQGVWTPLNNLVLSFRGGHYFLNEKLGTYGIGSTDFARSICSTASPAQFPAGFGCQTGGSNGIPFVSNTLFDATTRNTFDADITFITNFAGRHELKGGYQFNGIGNKVLLKDNDTIVLRSGQDVATYSQSNIPNTGGTADNPSGLCAPGQMTNCNIGSGSLIIYSEQGDVSSSNNAIYFQDKWQPFNRLTLNLGVRVEREDVPSFTEGLPGIRFDFMDKIAPRLGVAFDLTGDGKTKISAFYGWFYDRFKYELPRGSFGGAVYHQFFFEIFPTDTFASFTVASILGNGGPVIGGSCPATLTPIFGRVRCDVDYRVPSNSGGDITQVGGIDPNIKAFRQSEFTVTFERDLGKKFSLGARFSHKQVDHTVEDAGFPNAQGSEFYIIGNPGEGLYAEYAQRFGVLALKPQRQYDALEIILNRAFANDFYFSANYTLSRLWGNYSGLASSDEDGRLSPNVNRFFDQPQANWTVAGGPDNGILSTDRPHVFKFYGAYSLDWDKRFGFGANNTTEFQLFTTVQSGTPITSVVNLNNINVVLTERGDLGRTEVFTSTDFAIRHRFRFGRDNRFTLVFEADALNVFNENNVTNRNNLVTDGGFSVTNTDTYLGLITLAQANACNLSGNQQPCLLAGYAKFQREGSQTLYNLATSQNYSYPLYNQPSAFQAPRQIRFGMRFLF